MKRLCFACVALLFSFCASAQNLTEQWALTGGGTAADVGNTVATDHHGGIYIGGNFSSTSFNFGSIILNRIGTSTNGFIAKVDTSGTVLWANNFANSDITAVAVDASGFIYAIGTGLPLTKFTNSGTIIWQSGVAKNYRTIQLDSRGNVYAGDYLGFTKYRSDGSVVYTKTVPTDIAGGGFSIDRADNAHVLFHASGGTLINTSPGQSFSVNLTTRAIYDSIGRIISVQQISTLPLQYPKGYKAIFPNDYYMATQWHTLVPDYYMGIGHNSLGSTTGYGNCVYKEPVNPETDGFGDEFYAGQLYPFVGCNSVPSPAFTIGSIPISGITGKDIFYIKRNASGDVGFTTQFNGYTSEYPAKIAVDSVAKSVYIIGYWTKLADTSKFRFGNSVLVNNGNGSTGDLLLLKFGYGSPALTLNAGADKTICWGGSAQMTPSVNGGSGNYTYQWSPATGLSNASVLNPTAHPTVTTEYILTVTDDAGASVADTIKVVVDSNLYKPTISIIAGANPFCEGNNVHISSSAATSYQWSTGGSFADIFLNQPATVTVTTVRNDGCIGTSLPFVAVMNPRTATPTILPAGNASFCSGGSSTLTAQNTESSVSYHWNTGAITSSILVNAPGTYSVSSTGSNGCPSLTASKTVTMNSLPAGTITANGNTSFCSGDSVQLTISTPAANAILWSNGSTANSIWVKTSGTYSAAITSPQGCSSTTNSINVVVNSLPPTPTINANGPLSFCQGGTVVLTAQSNQTGINYSWNTGAVTPAITVNSAGNYSVKAINSNGCTSAPASVTVNIYALPTATVSLTGSSSFCEGDSVQLNVSTANGNSYTWNTGAGTSSIWVRTAGTYSVQVHSPQGCSNQSNTVTTTVLSRPAPSVLQQDNLLIASPANSSYQWYLNGNALQGAISQMLTIVQGGDYSVKVTAANGCSAFAFLSAVLRIVNPYLSYQVYPNPPVNSLAITYTIGQPRRVSVRVRNWLGQVVYTVVNDQLQNAGDHQYILNDLRKKLPDHFYIIEFNIDGKIITHKLAKLE